MGRERQIKAARRAAHANEIVLEELDYLRLSQARGLVNEAVLQGQAEVQQAQAQAEQRVKAAQQTLNERLQAMAAKYHFDPAATYRTDDARCLLVKA